MSNKSKRTVIEVHCAGIATLTHDNQGFICLTDPAKRKNPEHSDDVIATGCATEAPSNFCASGSA